MGIEVSPAAARVLPFGVYIMFLGGMAIGHSLAEVLPTLGRMMPGLELWHYPVKTLAVAALLLAFWPRYEELRGRAIASTAQVAVACAVGIGVYAMWIHLDRSWAVLGTAPGYNPFSGGHMGIPLAVIRMLGAAIVVPVMEELFWRSFLLRYLITPQFQSVPIGAFSWMSWSVTIVLFGFEHYLWLAGMVAGLIYTLLCYHTRSLWPAIVAHGVTNFCLGVHVLVTGEWHWW
jgi:CAAX prenyl protease-like protein